MNDTLDCLRGLLDSSVEALLIVDSEGEILWSNVAAARFLGYDNHELEGLSITKLIPESDDENLFLPSVLDNIPLVDINGNQLTGRVKSVTGESSDRLSLVSLAPGHLPMAFFRYRGQGLCYRALLDSVPLGLWVADENDRIVYWNPAMEQITGVKTDKALGEEICSYLPLDRQKVISLYLGAKGTGTPRRYEELDVRGEGAWSGLFLPLVDNGYHRGTLCTLIDSTERFQDRQDLYFSEMQLRRAEIIAGFGHWEFDLKTGTVRASAGAREIYGLHDELITIARAQEIPLPEEREKLDNALRELVHDGKAYDIEFSIQRATDGEVRVIHSMARYDREDRTVFGIIHDITENVRANRKLRESEIRFRQIAENLDEVVWLISDEELLYVSPSYEAIWGQSCQSLYEDPSSFTELVHPEDKEEVIRRYERIREGEMIDMEYRILRADGEVRWIRARTFPVSLDEGKSSRYVGLAEDITTHIRQQEELKRSLEEKETLLRELYHRTRNNMQVIISLFKLQGLKKDSQEVNSMVQEMTDRIQAISLVHQKLYQSGNLSRIRLDHYMGELFELLLNSYQVSDMKIERKIDVDELNVVIDIAIPCGLIVNELVSNSLRHAFPHGRGTITMEIRSEPKGIIRLVYQDDGPGLPDTMDPFALESVGMQTIVNIGKHQLEGEIRFDFSRGFRFTLLFPEQGYRTRIQDYGHIE
jgi:PAS domain S-box-containing protein